MATFSNINGFRLFRELFGSHNDGVSDGPPFIKITKSSQVNLLEMGCLIYLTQVIILT